MNIYRSALDAALLEGVINDFYLTIDLSITRMKKMLANFNIQSLLFSSGAEEISISIHIKKVR